MPLHKAPKTAAEKLALHLEMNYGLQLDPVRHKVLVAELDVFLLAAELAPEDSKAEDAIDAELRELLKKEPTDAPGQ